MTEKDLPVIGHVHTAFHDDNPDAPRGVLRRPAQAGVREALAVLCHQQWSSWIKYMLSVCSEDRGPFNPDGTVTIPKEAIDHWLRQTSTPHAELTEEARDSTRRRADEIIVLLATFCEVD